jgi:hypothetical protein
MANITPNNNGNPGALGGFNFASPTFGPFPQVTPQRGSKPGDPQQVPKSQPAQPNMWPTLMTPKMNLSKKTTGTNLKIQTGTPGGLGK